MGSGGVTALKRPISGLLKTSTRASFSIMTLRTSENDYPPDAVALTNDTHHARVVVVVTPVSTTKLNVLKHARLQIQTQHGSGALRSIKMWSLVVFVLWIGPEPPFSLPSVLCQPFCLCQQH